MNKAAVTALLMEKTGLPRKEAAEAVETFLNSIKEGLQNGERVSLVGLGTFRVKVKSERIGRNPKNGADLKIPEKRVVIFKPGKSFREEVEISK